MFRSNSRVRPGRAAALSFLRQVGGADTKGGVLITSRSPEEWLGNDVYRLQLSGLDRKDAVEYADHLLAALPQAQKRRQDRAYDELLEMLSGHPLSLRLMLPKLEQAEAQTLVEVLQGERVLPRGSTGEGRLDSLGACVDYSIRHLGEQDRTRLPALCLFQGRKSA